MWQNTPKQSLALGEKIIQLWTWWEGEYSGGGTTQCKLLLSVAFQGPALILDLSMLISIEGLQLTGADTEH